MSRVSGVGAGRSGRGATGKVRPLEEAVSRVRERMTVLLPGFMAVGSPRLLIDAICERRIGDLTVVYNDGAFPGKGIGKLVDLGLVRRFIGSHMGTNPVLQRQIAEGKVVAELYPQGTLAEKIRAAGAGLGGILTPTGVGTKVQENKQVLQVGGRSYILELPLRGDIALLYACKGDRKGNLVYRKAARNFNPLMAMAADLVIAEVEDVREVGEIDPDEVVTPGIFVDIVVDARAERARMEQARAEQARIQEACGACAGESAPACVLAGVRDR